MLSAINAVASAVEQLAQRVEALEQAKEEDANDENEGEGEGEGNVDEFTVSSHIGQLVTRVFHSDEVKRVMAKVLSVNGGH